LESLPDALMKVFFNQEAWIYFIAIVSRVTGLEALLIVLSMDMASTSSLEHVATLLSRSAPLYYSQELYGLGVANDFRSPGVIGFGYLIGGSPLLLWLYGFSVTLFFFLPCILKIRFYLKAPVYTIFLLLVLSIMMEGYLAWQELLTIAVSSALLVWVDSHLTVFKGQRVKRSS
jgi:hypothetical protein